MIVGLAIAWGNAANTGQPGRRRMPGTTPSPSPEFFSTDVYRGARRGRPLFLKILGPILWHCRRRGSQLEPTPGKRLARPSDILIHTWPWWFFSR